MEVSEPAYDLLLKVLLIGETGVGKSSILMRFTDNTFVEDGPPTIGVDFKYKLIEKEGKLIKVALWDTAGQERYRSLTSTFYRGSHGILLVYDCTDRSSFERLDFWLKEIVEECSNPQVVKVLLGNKIDKSGIVVQPEEGANFAREHGMLFVQTSAKTRAGIERAFDELILRMLDAPNAKTMNVGNPKLNLRSKGNKAMCCK